MRGMKKFDHAAETYRRTRRKLKRTIELGDISFVTELELPSGIPTDIPLAISWRLAVLLGAEVVLSGTVSSEKRPLRIADLFSGCGGFSRGVVEAARALGFDPEVVFGADQEKNAASVFKHNFCPDVFYDGSVSDLVDFQFTTDSRGAVFKYPPTPLLPSVKELVDQVDILVAGPPCQGHSNFNNKSRRIDPRNLLYLTVPAFAVAVKAKCVLIENVPEVVNDSRNVVAMAADLFENHGYRVVTKTLVATDYGVAQTRKRHIMVAIRSDFEAKPSFDTLEGFKVPGFKLKDVMGDLLGMERRELLIDKLGELSTENKRRIQYLFDNDLYELPNEERPDCHKDGHTYPSVYGRLRWNEPSGTLTTGFLSPGRGRFIHPLEPRGLTLHEAARIQGFPDTFEFVTSGDIEGGRTNIATLIGQAVPPPLGYAAALVALGAVYGRLNRKPDLSHDIVTQKLFHFESEEDCLLSRTA